MMSLQTCCNRWIGLLTLLAAAGILGFVAGIVGLQRASAGETPYPSDLFPYTYRIASGCSVGYEVEPVNVVFANHGFSWEIANQAHDHGGWSFNVGTNRLMGDQNGCRTMSSQRASNPDLPFEMPRFQIKYFEHWAAPPITARRDIGDLRSIASAAAFHDEPIGCGRAVDDETLEFTFPWATVDGGFNRAREDIRKNWVANSDHVLEDIRYWDNRRPMEQCDHDPPEEWGIARSDGWVYYVRTFDATTDYDGDGCRNEAELQTIVGSETTGGRRNPADPWDYYDVNQDGFIDLFIDILGVILHYSLDGSPPYDANFDRGPSAGPNPWNMTAPDGSIDLFIDILGVIKQYGHDCASN